MLAANLQDISSIYIYMFLQVLHGYVVILPLSHSEPRQSRWKQKLESPSPTKPV